MLVLKLKKVFPFLLLSFPVVIDIINGYLRGTDGTSESFIGILYRGIIILFSAIYLFRTKYSNYIKTLILSSIALLIYHILIGAYSNGVFMALVKIMNFYFVLSIILKNRYFNDREIVVKAAILYGVLAAIILVYCFITGAGYAAYTENTFGTKGFFVAMNDVGLTILLLNILACYSFQKTGNVFYFVALILMSIGSCLVGSITCYFGTAFILLFFALSILLVKFEDYKSSYKIKLITLFGGLVISNYALVNVISVIQEDSYLSRKYEDIGAIFLEASGRRYLIDASIKTITNFNVFDWCFGRGNFYLMENQHQLYLGEPKAAEVDPLDLIGQFGLLFSIPVLLLPIKKLIACIRNFIKCHNILDYWCIIAFLCFIGHAFYGGHAYTSPLVLSYLAVFIYVLDSRDVNKYI